LQRRTSEKNMKSWGKPDLILIDGGKGQLDAALKALEERNLKIPAISIAKREEEIIVHSTRSHIGTTKLLDILKNPTDNIYVSREGEYYIVNLHPGQINASSHSGNLRGASTFSTYSDVTKLFQRIRDESHRFAISYHTVLKRAKQTASMLDEIPGIGPVTRRALIRKFGSLRGVQAATTEQLIDAVGPSKTALITPYLQTP